MAFIDKYFAIFAWISVVYFIGILFFTKGFLLKRVVINQNSSCAVNYSAHFIHESEANEGCWMHRRFSKSIILLIDALRFDFIKYHPHIKNNELPYQNKFKTVNHLLHKNNLHSRLYQFIADPPTTTMQRLKGLTTGSLPTFVDAGANFASSEITEDNFIDQLLGIGKKIVFMGDDTWESLFPGRFHRFYPFPSFNVKDLHTVDNGVLEHLLPEIRRDDWDMLIAHFLGVDHCGHRYGPNHPAMADKLTQMDQVIRSRQNNKSIFKILLINKARTNMYYGSGPTPRHHAQPPHIYGRIRKTKQMAATWILKEATMCHLRNS